MQEDMSNFKAQAQIDELKAENAQLRQELGLARYHLNNLFKKMEADQGGLLSAYQVQVKVFLTGPRPRPADQAVPRATGPDKAPAVPGQTSQ